MKKILGLFIPISICFFLLTGFGNASQFREPEKPKSDPVSTTGSLYGYQGELQEDVLSDAPFELVSGKYEVSGIQRLVTDGYAAQSSGKTSLALSSSYLRSETETEAAPMTGRFEDLLVSGSLNAAQGLGTSQCFYINSSLITRSGAAAMLDKAPANESQKLSLYLYGSEAIAADGGFGANSDLFSKLYVYGSHIQAAEVGILAGTNSDLAIGTIKDGEEITALSGKLEDSEKDRWKDKDTGSVIEGGRNALVIYSENLPEYWEYEGYSKDELLKKYTNVFARGSTFRTDKTLDKGISYGEAQDGYINHTRDSVVLIKSTNAAINFEDCELIAGKDGAGNVIHTVINNDPNMIAFPDGAAASPIHISMKDMDVKGNILHEDYQRDLGLTLKNTTLSGAINGYDAAHWNSVAVQEGFKDYCPDETYNTQHHAAVAITEGSSWTITADSHLGWLYIDETSNVTGKIVVDGVEQSNVQGSTYAGNIVIIPSDTSSAPAVHDHNWVKADGGSPATCETSGVAIYKCSICGEPYYDYLPPLGHDWQVSYQYGPFCDKDGYADYICARCGAKQEVIFPAGHDMHLSYHQDVGCETWGYDVYMCSRCSTTEIVNEKEPLGHIYKPYPTPGNEMYTHTYGCSRCGEILATEAHSPVGGVCMICMQSGL